MKDAFGNKVEIGDHVGVTLSTSSYTSNIYKGRIIGFVKRSGYECAQIKVRGYWGSKEMLVTRSSKKIVKLK